MRLRRLAVRALAEGVISTAMAEKIYPEIRQHADIDDLTTPSLLDARQLMQVSMTERNRVLRQAAAAAAREYDEGGALSGFESLAEEDHRDVSIQED